MQDGRFMEVTESREVVLTHQDVRVTKRRQNSTLWVQLVLKFLRTDARVQLKLLWRIKHSLKLNLLPCPINYLYLCVCFSPAMSSTVYKLFIHFY